MSENGDVHEGLEEQDNTDVFITKTKQAIQQKGIDPEIPLSTKEFKKLIMNLKKENLFLIEHINEEERILEK
jgi:hypothetical protein